MLTSSLFLLCSKLEHENIIKCIGFDIERGCLIMSLADENLNDLLERKKYIGMRLEEKYSLARDIVSGVLYMHHHNYLHMDIKRANILVCYLPNKIK